MRQIYRDKSGILRFRSNPLVESVYAASAHDLNYLATLKFSAADRREFAQLLGYSIAGYEDLPYVSVRELLDVRNTVNRTLK